MDILKLFRKSKASATTPASNTSVLSSSVETPLSLTLVENKNWIEQQLANCSDICYLPRFFGTEMQYGALVVYCDSLINDKN
jgi:spore germination protein